MASALNVVPTTYTRRIVEQMISAAAEETGPDAVLKLLPKVEPRQVPALVGLLLTNTKVTRKMGRPRLPERFTDAERKAANNRYKKGARDPETVAAWREYQRLCQRRRSERVGRFGRA